MRTHSFLSASVGRALWLLTASASATAAATAAAADWSPVSWRRKSVHQDVVYDDPAELATVLSKLEHLPPLVAPGEIENLKKLLQEVAEGKRFLLQGGDCAELFDYCSQDPIQNKLKVLLQMSLILVWGGRTSVVRIARMAGQYAKPRSKPTEMVNGTEYVAFRGDNRLLGAYFHSAATINYVRALLASDFADLHHPESWNLQSEHWNLEHVRNPDVRKEYQAVVSQLPEANHATRTADVFMSHEGLMLEYETTLTREVQTPRNAAPSAGAAADGSAPPPPQPPTKSYNLGTHFLWIGDRTRQLTGAHVEYFRGIANPIGVKVGPSMQPDELVALLNVLNPDKEVGKVTLITRYGAGKVREYLPGHIRAVQGSGHKVVWCCDPMHGNTEAVASGVKTRRFEHIVAELTEAFEIHGELGTHLGGVHCELTGEPVTETIGGSNNLGEADLSTNYQTFCDPRLNYTQSLDVAFLIAKYFRSRRASQSPTPPAQSEAVPAPSL
ncbi:DAHP synthetase [Entophlyctis helioformis]|nr:DAHP synthetase [Entophlyctis helioformis]